MLAVVGRTSNRSSPAFSRRRVAAALVGLALAGCEGETLYEGPPVVAPPVMEVEVPPSAIAGGFIDVSVRASDPLGVTGVELEFSGVASGRIAPLFDPARPTVALDTAFALPFEISGVVEVKVTARNRFGAVTPARTASVQVVIRDTIAPSLGASAVVSPRMELTDPIRVTMTASDDPHGQGLRRFGATAVAVDAGDPSRTVVFRAATLLLPAPDRGSVTRQLAVFPSGIDPRALPDTFHVQVYAYAVDEAGNCAAALAGSPGRFPCSALPSGDTVAATTGGPPARTILVAGRTVSFAPGSQIMDLEADPGRGRLYMSNLPYHQVEVLDVRSMSLLGPVRVGSRPWGMTLNRTRDTLIVANSGGTNLSFIPLTGALREDLTRRLPKPNVQLYQCLPPPPDELWPQCKVTELHYSDRPQYVAQDSAGILFQSTLTTPAAPAGIIQFAEQPPEWRNPEVKILLRNDVIASPRLKDHSPGWSCDDPLADTLAFTYVDSVRIHPIDPVIGGIRAEIFDHIPGDTTQVIVGEGSTVAAAVNAVRAKGSDVYCREGVWRPDSIPLADTTFVVASTDRAWIAFGESGSRNPGRILLWGAKSRTQTFPLYDRIISSQANITDLVDNTSERIRGLALNRDGTLGVFRGVQGAYFFTNNLRLQGTFVDGVPGGAGIAIHPDLNLAFIGTPDGTVRIFDPVHYVPVGEIAIRDVVIGPLEVARPFPGDPPDVIGKLFAATTGGVVVVNVYQSDVRTN